MTDPNEYSAEDTLKILVATDIHLGYAEKDRIRGQDTFNTFREILEIAKRQEVDFILLGGDLFHDAQPSSHCATKCIKLLREYCVGDKPVCLELFSDPNKHFGHPVVNYEDPNINISLPVFSIHGNHDDPTGIDHESTLELLSSSRFINYFGRCDSLNEVNISPVLLEKGRTKLALYGLSHIRDERLGRLYKDKKVKMLSPTDRDDWFNLLVLHQNRVQRSSKNFVPETSLPNFLDLVIWGHEHDCRIEPEKKLNGVPISQPGSSVATSLSEGESLTKHVGLLKIRGKKFQMIPKELKTVRPFKFDELCLFDEPEDNEDEKTWNNRVQEIVTNKIADMIQEAKDLGREKSVSDKPLIKLIVKYQHEHSVFNGIRFGQAYSDKVANPDSMINFHLIKETKHKRRRNVGQNADDDDDKEEVAGALLANRVEDLVSQHFTEVESLNFFPLNVINESVKRFVDTNDNNAVTDVTDNLIKEMMKVLEKDMPPVERTREAIQEIKTRMAPDSLNFVNRVLRDPKRKNKKATNVDYDSDELDVEDNATAADAGSSGRKPRGRGAARGKRGRGAAASTTNADSDDNDNAGGKNTTVRGRGATRARRARGSRTSSVTIDDDDEDVKPDIQSGRGKAAAKNKKPTSGFWG